MTDKGMIPGSSMHILMQEYSAEAMFEVKGYADHLRELAEAIDKDLAHNVNKGQLLSPLVVIDMIKSLMQCHHNSLASLIDNTKPGEPLLELIQGELK